MWYFLGVGRSSLVILLPLLHTVTDGKHLGMSQVLPTSGEWPGTGSFAALTTRDIWRCVGYSSFVELVKPLCSLFLGPARDKAVAFQPATSHNQSDNLNGNRSRRSENIYKIPRAPSPSSLPSPPGGLRNSTEQI